MVLSIASSVRCQAASRFCAFLGENLKEGGCILEGLGSIKVNGAAKDKATIEALFWVELLEAEPPFRQYEEPIKAIILG